MKRHLQPLDAFSGFLMRPKCISDRGGTLTAPQTLAGGEGARCPLPKNRSLALGLEFRPFEPQECTRQDKFLATLLSGLSARIDYLNTLSLPYLTVYFR